MLLDILFIRMITGLKKVSSSQRTEKSKMCRPEAEVLFKYKKLRKLSSMHTARLLIKMIF